MKSRTMIAFVSGVVTTIGVIALAASQMLPEPAVAEATEAPIVLAAGQQVPGPTGAGSAAAKWRMIEPTNRLGCSSSP